MSRKAKNTTAKAEKSAPMDNVKEETLEKVKSEEVGTEESLEATLTKTSLLADEKERLDAEATQLAEAEEATRLAVIAEEATRLAEEAEATRLEAEELALAEERKAAAAAAEKDTCIVAIERYIENMGPNSVVNEAHCAEYTLLLWNAIVKVSDYDQVKGVKVLRQMLTLMAENYSTVFSEEKILRYVNQSFAGQSASTLREIELVLITFLTIINPANREYLSRRLSWSAFDKNVRPELAANLRPMLMTAANIQVN